jgi:hypothetical protein
MEKLQGKVALDGPTSPIPDLVKRLSTGPPFAEVGWEPSTGRDHAAISTTIRLSIQ